METTMVVIVFKIGKSTGEFSGTSVYSSLSREHPLFGCHLS